MPTREHKIGIPFSTVDIGVTQQLSKKTINPTRVLAALLNTRSFSEIGRRSGLKADRVSRILMGRISPTLHTAWVLHLTLGVTLETLYLSLRAIRLERVRGRKVLYQPRVVEGVVWEKRVKAPTPEKATPEWELARRRRQEQSRQDRKRRLGLMRRIRDAERRLPPEPESDLSEPS